MSSRPALGSTHPPIQWVPGTLSPGVKRPGRGTDHSPPTSAQVKKKWVYTSTIHTPSWRSAYLVKYRDNFTFYLLLDSGKWGLCGPQNPSRRCEEVLYLCWESNHDASVVKPMSQSMYCATNEDDLYACEMWVKLHEPTLSGIVFICNLLSDASVIETKQHQVIRWECVRNWKGMK
jgi:hypothetical protein